MRIGLYKDYIVRLFRKLLGDDLRILTAHVDNWDETRIMHNGEYSIGVDAYEDYYSAHWMTSQPPSQFVETLDKLGARDHNLCYVGFQDKDMKQLKYSDLRAMKSKLGTDCSFLRVESDDFTAIWNYEEAVNDYIIAFTSEKRKTDALFSLYQSTARHPKTAEIRRPVTRILERYKG